MPATNLSVLLSLSREEEKQRVTTLLLYQYLSSLRTRNYITCSCLVDPSCSFWDQFYGGADDQNLMQQWASTDVGLRNCCSFLSTNTFCCLVLGEEVGRRSSEPRAP